jgi:hypothetical protein
MYLKYMISIPTEDKNFTNEGGGEDREVAVSRSAEAWAVTTATVSIFKSDWRTNLRITVKNIFLY